MDNQILKQISQMTALSKTDKKIAAYIESHYPYSVLQGIEEIGQNCKVSTASVSRFVNKLGYDSFADFRKLGQNDINQRLQSPIIRYKSKLNETPPYRQHFVNCIANLEETMARIEEDAFNAVVEKLVSAKTLYVAGGASAQVLAKYFVLLSSYFRGQVKLIPPDISTIAHHLVDINENDVLLVISQQRSSSISTKLASFFKQKNCEVILLSDKQISPIMPFASASLVICSDSSTLFNSRTVMLTLLEALMNAMVPFYSQSIEGRFELMEEVFDLFDVYSK